MQIRILQNESLEDAENLLPPETIAQEHAATRRHWDLRFELNNTLKIWALPKTPPQKIGEKRLAV
ncbi:DNA polymerase ligase N-terminal domain-containing protein [Candidatus Nitrosotenuis aquarius]|uniref:DNA polymerase ligase N-terminal domain-containing protein n=1 Tax=Candidatus Nitrosotenuis aquarius TaxID=1846278 RepID=UPI0021108392|nr:DNA polymerase ligase N-terminal domain-containing protein [Candidatus Nitrosotenuis aquarius]